MPRVEQGWGACDPANPRNRRRRCALLIERAGEGGVTTVLIDVGPDIREQLIGADVRHLDGVLLTHPHADHIHGIDDLRPLYHTRHARIDIHMDEPTALRVAGRLFPMFSRRLKGVPILPWRTICRLSSGSPCKVQGRGGAIEATPFDLDHGEINALGFRIGKLAYTPDVKRIPEASRPLLEGLDVWIVDALRYRPHPSHFSLDEALAEIEAMRPKRAILTNMHVDLDYETLRKRLPEHIVPAYDGMRIEGFRSA